MSNPKPKHAITNCTLPPGINEELLGLATAIPPLIKLLAAKVLGLT